MRAALLISLFSGLCVATWSLSTFEYSVDVLTGLKGIYLLCFIISWFSLILGIIFVFLAVLFCGHTTIATMDEWQRWIDDTIKKGCKPWQIEEQLYEATAKDLAKSQSQCYKNNEHRFGHLKRAQRCLAVALLFLLVLAISKAFLDSNYSVLRKENIMYNASTSNPNPAPVPAPVPPPTPPTQVKTADDKK
jgi:uncharacterized membrane protein